MADTTEVVGVWYNVLGAALQIPGARVNRAEFLVKEFGKYCNPATIEKIFSKGTAAAGVEAALMDKVAEDTINLHAGIAASLSFAAGIPGGLAMLATVPADIAQYYYHVIAAAQKLAYTYGFLEMPLVEDDFKSLITLLLGVMADIEDANTTVTELYASQVSREMAAMAMGKALNKAALKTALALAYRLTGKSVFKSIWKAVPVLGGVVSGGITLCTFLPMCNNLKTRLHRSVEAAKKMPLLPSVAP
ncbi:MAG: hypothetical protein LBD13_04110 [Spirochaetaceae bacterium]|jgi:hypothetical protein|nr:hypothetical protein [Spirochaetaceae bacterium]